MRMWPPVLATEMPFCATWENPIWEQLDCLLFKMCKVMAMTHRVIHRIKC